jgi:hypothetical protein
MIQTDREVHLADLTTVAPYFKIYWEDFTIKDVELTNTEVDIETLYATDNLKLCALNFAKYIGYANSGYGEGTASRGITEQEAYDIWISVFESEQRVFKKQLVDAGILTLPQSVYDGLMLYFWSSRTIYEVRAAEGIYTTRDAIVSKNYDLLSNMIARSKVNRQICLRAATILMLGDYGKLRDRRSMRSSGIFSMRGSNETGALTTEQLKRARFAYYAETLKFLPLTPESLKRDIAKRYEETLDFYSFKYEDSNVFLLNKAPSMYPVEKLSIKVNGVLIQHNYDYKLDNRTVTIDNYDLKENDIIEMTIRI